MLTPMLDISNFSCDCSDSENGLPDPCRRLPVTPITPEWLRPWQSPGPVGFYSWMAEAISADHCSVIG
tara:strand:- start:619 stop:822 length:204 start_codon:yes stop_codon:yes gene_type:complete